MMVRAREALLPAYLLLCLVIGGSTQAIWGNAGLQLLAIGILAWSAMTRDPLEMPRAARSLLLIVLALIFFIALQLLPLPPAAWTALPSRQFLVEGYALLGVPLPWLPISLFPDDTMTTALTLLPPIALLVGMLRLRAWNPGWMLAAVVTGAVLSVMLGILQVTGSGNAWYLYKTTNLGVAVGTFANGNHFATLLLAALPALAVLFALSLGTNERQARGSLAGAIVVAAGAVLALGFLINGSIAALLIGPPILAASALLVLRPSPQRMRQAWIAIGALAAAGALAVVALGPNLPGRGTQTSIEKRVGFWDTTLEAAGDHLLTGSGIGTFQKVYRLYEDPASVDRFYVNHAHNDYLEIALEGGVFAVVLLLLFLWWWASRAVAAWTATHASPAPRATAIASGAILLHSIVDFPLRTAAIAAVLAVCLALLAGARVPPRPNRTGNARPARHATL